MEYYNQVFNIVDSNIGQPLGQTISLDKETSEYISHSIIGFFSLFLIIQLIQIISSLFASNKPQFSQSKTSQSGAKSNQSRKKLQKRFLLICGAPNSGKTTLFYHLLTKEVRMMVSSTEVNETQGAMEVKIPGSATQSGQPQSKAIHIVDIPGHYHFKDQRQDSLEETKAIILVVDSKDKERLTEASEILYDILNNITIQSDRIPILIACNKQDLQFAKKATSIENEMEKEIDELRKVKRATQDDTSKIGYLENLKKKFTFSDMQVPVRFAECKLKDEDIIEVYKFISSNF